MSDYQPIFINWDKTPLREWLGAPLPVYAVLRNGKRLRKSVRATLERGAGYRKPTLIHKGRKP
jgi:hypothetical protein